ncbi:MAG: hypothetical protein HOP23_16065 [Methylococcaceae bacterium]|nr:hypothetical protein [Methylococcaceae bacterium]
MITSSVPIRFICRIGYFLLPVLFSAQSTLAVSATNTASDEHIRQIVESLLKEKDKKIEQLEARIVQMERERQNSNANMPISSAPSVTVSESAPQKPEPDKISEETEAKQNAITGKLVDLGEQVEELREAAKEKGLDISGFFDVNAKTDNATDQNFSVGSVELDLEYGYDDHFAASSALVLCGNSSGADFSAPAAITCGGSGPGGIGAGGSGIAVALVDFHMFDNSIPPRGRIFNNQGFHIQAGRFDLPFSSDYQYYANKDRVTVTAPITTSRIQFGGFNGDGVRSYGSWKHLNYSVFWTDAMYANDGTSLGGRVGLTYGQNIYRTHHANPEGIEFGLSQLTDLDGDRNVRNMVYGADLSFGYGIMKLQSELLWLKAQHNLFTTVEGEDPIDRGKPNEMAYHATLIANLEKYLKHPLSAFVRYGRWQPKHRAIEDSFDGSVVGINALSQLTVGLNYKFNEYMTIKFEYTDSLGTSTQEHYFDKKLGIAQMVLAF